MASSDAHDSDSTRRAALAILCATAASWWPAARAATSQPAPLRIGFQKGSLNLALLKRLVNR